MQQQLVQLNDNQSLLINTQRQDRIDKISRQLSLLNKEEDYQDFDLKKVLQKKRNQILEQNEEFKTLCDKNYKDVQKEIQKSVSVKRAKLVAESKKKSAPKFVQNSRNPISKQLEQDLKKINRLITQNIDFISTKKPQSAKRIRG